MKKIVLCALFALMGVISYGQDYANDNNYYMIVLDGENAYINKNTGEVVKSGAVRNTPTKKEVSTYRGTTSTSYTLDGGHNVHIVEKGQTLFGIARGYGVSINELLALNGLSKSSTLSVGQRIEIPTKATSGSYTVDTYNGSASTYTVRRGDTLYSIAKRFNTSVANIKAKNGLYSNLIRVGQVLEVK